MAVLTLAPGWSSKPEYQLPPTTLPPAAEVDPRADEFRVYTLPPGTPLPVMLQTPVHTAINHVGDPIEAAVTQPFYLGAQQMISKDSRLSGHIVRLEPPVVGRNAILAVAFSELTLFNGERIPVSAHVRTGKRDHTWGGQLTPGTEYKRVTHRVMGVGTYNKSVLAGPRQQGQHLGFEPGERFTIVFEQPVTLVVPNPDHWD